MLIYIFYMFGVFKALHIFTDFYISDRIIFIYACTRVYVYEVINCISLCVCLFHACFVMLWRSPRIAIFLAVEQ